MPMKQKPENPRTKTQVHYQREPTRRQNKHFTFEAAIVTMSSRHQEAQSISYIYKRVASHQPSHRCCRQKRALNW